MLRTVLLRYDRFANHFFLTRISKDKLCEKVTERE